MKYTISSGGHTMQAEGDTPFDACVAAVKSGAFDRLGQIMEAIPEGATEDDDDKVVYCSSERVCKDAGMWAEPPAASEGK